MFGNFDNMFNFDFDALQRKLDEQLEKVDEYVRELDRKEEEERNLQREIIEEEEAKNYTESLKKIVIKSSKCVSCGLCSEMCKLIEESSDGKAIVKGSGIVNNNDMEEIEMIISSCPEEAISLRNTGIVKSEGQQGIKELKDIIIKEFKNYKVHMPERECYRFDCDSFYIESPRSNKANLFDYSSYNSAMREGLREFDRIMYSNKRTLIQKLLVEYKTRCLDPFIYDYDEESNYYYQARKEISKRLEVFVAQAESLLGKKLSLEDDFCKIKARPVFGTDGSLMSREGYVYQLRHLEEVWVLDKIANQIESLSWFDSYIDTNDIEDYRGNDKYSFSIDDAVQELRSQILNETFSVLNDSDGVAGILENNFPRITRAMDEEINSKISKLLNQIDGSDNNVKKDNSCINNDIH